MECPKLTRDNNKNERKIYPQKNYDKYNSDHFFLYHFTEEGLFHLRKKYKQVRGLPPFIHNLMKGRALPARNLFLTRPSLFDWSSDRTVLTVPNLPNLGLSIDEMKDIPHETLKNNPQGLILTSWTMDPRLLETYGWQKEEIHENNNASFFKFLNNHACATSSDYKFFQRTNSQKELFKTEKKWE